MTRLAIVQLLPALDLGGVERGTLEIARAIVAAGHRSIVVSDGGRLVERLVRDGSEHIAWKIGAKSPLTLRFIAKLDALVRAQRIDIIHARSRVPAWIGWLAWRRMSHTMRPRLVTTVHGMYSVSRYSEVMTYGERVIAVSRAVADYISRAYPRCPRGKVRIIPRGVDADEFPYGHVPDANWRAQWERDHPFWVGKRLIVLPGRVTRLKGHETFIEVLARLRTTHRDAHGIVVGGGRPGRIAALKALATRLNAPVTLLGPRDDVREIIASSALVVSTSTQPEFVRPHRTRSTSARHSGRRLRPWRRRRNSLRRFPAGARGRRRPRHARGEDFALSRRPTAGAEERRLFAGRDAIDHGPALRGAGRDAATMTDDGKYVDDAWRDRNKLGCSDEPIR